MRLALITDVYPPLRSSGAIQLRDLSFELGKQGHEVTVLVATPGLSAPWKMEVLNGINIVRLRTPRTKDVGYVRRTVGEVLMPFSMLRNLRKSPIRGERWEGIVWYSPTIFLGPIVKALKKSSNCRGYLIVRDIFPQWAVNLGLIGKGLPYFFFNAIADRQYSAADVIGIQAVGDQVYFSKQLAHSAVRIEVLQNWLADAPVKDCSISLAATPLADRKIFVYAGNMGVAQGAGILLDLAKCLKYRTDIGFLFVGRGTDARRLQEESAVLGLDNIAFFGEIDPDEIPGLFEQCHAGLMTLDARHKTHNVPGKFLSYMRAGLPVLAIINPGNDLVELIVEERVGRASIDSSVSSVAKQALALMDEAVLDGGIKHRCRQLAARLFAPELAARQIVRGLR